MSSLHEQIQARLFECLDLPGIKTRGRNLELTDDVALPAGSLHDAVEEAADHVNATGISGNSVTLTAGLTILFRGSAEVAGEAIADPVGPAKSEWLAKVQKAVLLDAPLARLCAGVRPSGARYVSSEFTFAEGIGQLDVKFAVTYAFDPRAL